MNTQSNFPHVNVFFFLSDHRRSLNSARVLFLVKSQIYYSLFHAGFSHTTVRRQSPLVNAPIAEWQGPQSMSNQMSKVGRLQTILHFHFPNILECCWDRIYMTECLCGTSIRGELEISERKPSADMIAICYSH